MPYDIGNAAMHSTDIAANIYIAMTGAPATIAPVPVLAARASRLSFYRVRQMARRGLAGVPMMMTNDVELRIGVRRYCGGHFMRNAH